MESWLKISLLLCMFGFFKELRPSEPFVTPYLVGPHWNLTAAQVSQEVYPFGTYSYLGLLVAVFLVTDILKYKSVIIFDAVCGVVAWCLLIWGQGIPLAQLLEFFYGAFMAGEVAYYSYAYARIENRELYARLTSHTRSACLFGRCASGILGQALYSSNTADLRELNYISVVCLSIALGFALCLPPVKHSIYFHRKECERTPPENLREKGICLQDGRQHSIVKEIEPTNCVDGEVVATGTTTNRKFSIPTINLTPPDCLTSIECDAVESPIDNHVSSLDNIVEPSPPLPSERTCSSAYLSAFKLLWKHAYTSYSNLWVLRWSAWWTISTAGFLQMLSYVQVLWEVILKEKEAQGVEVEIYNGAIEAAQTVLGALATLGCGWLRLNWEFVGEFSLAGIALIQGLVMIVSSLAKELWLAYLCYVIFGILYQTMVTVASMEVAKKIEEDCYGLVFGINTFVALVLQTIWTIVVVTEAGFALGARDQFIVCGAYFLVLGLFFLVIALTSICRMGLSVFLKQPLWLPRPEVNSPAA